MRRGKCVQIKGKRDREREKGFHIEQRKGGEAREGRARRGKRVSHRAKEGRWKGEK